MSETFVFLSQFCVNFRKVTLATGVPLSARHDNEILEEFGFGKHSDLSRITTFPKNIYKLTTKTIHFLSKFEQKF